MPIELIVITITMSRCIDMSMIVMPFVDRLVLYEQPSTESTTILSMNLIWKETVIIFSYVEGRFFYTIGPKQTKNEWTIIIKKGKFGMRYKHIVHEGKNENLYMKKTTILPQECNQNAKRCQFYANVHRWLFFNKASDIFALNYVFACAWWLPPTYPRVGCARPHRFYLYLCCKNSTVLEEDILVWAGIDFALMYFLKRT